MLEKFNILALREEQPVGGACDRDVGEVVERADRAEARSDATQEVR